ncbi:MAG: glycosyltransferase family 4 protein [Alphaproteobacteria bacterium]
MKALFCHDTYYFDDGDTVFSYGAFPYALWRDRYLPHCDAVRVIGRAKNAKDGTPELSSGANVSFCLLENINTPFKRIFGARKIYRHILAEVQAADIVIIRGPVEFGMMAAKAARRTRTPYVVEMSGCAFDHTWYHGSLIGKLYAPIKYLRARHMVKHADAVLSVTQNFLQKRYPNARQCEHASNVEIARPDDNVLQNRLSKPAPDKIIFGLIGNHTNHLKGLPVALKALARIKDQIGDFELRILGQGDPGKWASLIQGLGLYPHVRFDGTLPGGEAVLGWLDDIDIYLQPSYHEGLPRALIESMSRGCPALSSNAGGTDELLIHSLIHKKGDHKTLSQHILSLLDDDLKAHSTRNFEIAQRYTKDALTPRRHAFYAHIFATLKD